jgi:hypothetical protein
MGRPGPRSADTEAAGRTPGERPSPYLTALASARRIRRRDLALVEQYLAQIRTVASQQARMAARRAVRKP